MPEQTKPTADDYKLIFEDHRVGAKIFEELVSRFGRIPTKSGGIDRVLDQFQYAGRREVIEFITLRINQAHGVDTNETE